jgi:hypothetical protein
MGTSPNLQKPMGNNERQEGVLPESTNEVPLALGLEESDILRIIGKRVEEAEQFWNKELGLDDVRKKSDDYYIGNTYQEDDLYEFQVPYKNNRILTAVETLLPMITSQIPQPIATEGRDTDESRELAHDLEDVLVAKYDDFGVRRTFTRIGRHLLMGKRVGILKYRFDPEAGERMPDGTRKGAIVVESVRPEKVVFDADASDPDNIPLIAEYMSDTVEDLVTMFPVKKKEIFAKFGIKRGVKSQISKKVGYIQVWFTYRDKSGDQQEGVAYKLEEILLGATKNPNWNYDEFEEQEDGKFRRLNYFDRPQKPYILVNHINTGKYVIDDTSLADQAMPLQDVLEKRGRQIVENADQASSGLVLNSKMISPDDAKKLIGDPSEKIMVDGDVREAAARLPYNMLPAYVINDKNDARSEIDNIFGANAALRGEEQQGDKLLGAMVLSQRANSGRLQTVTNAIEDACGREYGLYPSLVQMMKVYWDEPEVVRFNPTEGKTRFIDWQSDKIEDGVRVRVKEGSAIPKDKESLKQQTIQIAPTLDPLTLAEGLDYPNAKEVAKRMVYYRFFMDKYLSEILADDGSMVDQQAMADIQALLNGQTPPVPEEPSKKYIATLERFLNSQGFQGVQDVQIKQNIIQFAKMVNDKAKGGIGEAGETQSEQNPATETPAETEETVPTPGEPETPVAPGEAAPAPAPEPGQQSAAGQGFVQNLLSRFRRGQK